MTSNGFKRTAEARRARSLFFLKKDFFLRFLRGSAVRFGLCLLCVACPKPQTVAGPAPDAQALYAQAQAAHRIPETLSCDAKAFVEAPEKGGR